MTIEVFLVISLNAYGFHFELYFVEVLQVYYIIILIMYKIESMLHIATSLFNACSAQFKFLSIGG
jgi:hypothetical protein